MQSQRRHEKEKYEQDAQLDKKQENQSPKFFLVDFEEMRRPGCAGVPKQKRCAEIEQCEQEADDKCGQEKVPEENNFVAVHAAIIYPGDGKSITNGFAGLIR
jgi:tRNA G10  N-methylase Trm11